MTDKTTTATRYPELGCYLLAGQPKSPRDLIDEAIGAAVPLPLTADLSQHPPRTAGSNVGRTTMPGMPVVQPLPTPASSVDLDGSSTDFPSDPTPNPPKTYSFPLKTSTA